MIRRARLADLDDALALYESVAGEGRYIGAELPLDREARLTSWSSGFIENPQGAMFVADAARRLVGMATVSGTQVAELGMSVARDWRGQGVGTSLLRACIDWAKGSGAHKMTLQVWPHNDAAIALYRKFSFEQEGYFRRHWRRRNGELWDVVVMGLVLDEVSPGLSQ